MVETRHCVNGNEYKYIEEDGKCRNCADPTVLSYEYSTNQFTQEQIDKYRNVWLAHEDTSDTSDAELVEEMHQDFNFIQSECESFCEKLSRDLNQVNPDSDKYHAEGQNVGWRNVSGQTEVTLEDGNDLVDKLTPDSDWSMEVTVYNEMMSIKLFHHDSPLGETHELYPT